MKLYRKIVFIITGLWMSTGFTQSIINAEQYVNDKDSLILSLNVQYQGTRGNAISDQVTVTPTFIKLTDKHHYKLFGTYQLASGGGNTFLNSGFVHIRHNYALHKRYKTFTFYQLQYDEVLLLKQRQVYGGGFRALLLEKDSLSSSLGLGVMREFERLDVQKIGPNDIVDTRYWRMTLVHSFVFQVSADIGFSNILYFQPYLQDVGDYRLLSESMLSFEINHHLNFNIEHHLRMDSRPPSTLTDNDQSIKLGMRYKF